MGVVIRALTTLALGLAAPAKADALSPWSSHVAEASARFGVPAKWIVEVMRAESGGRTMVQGRPTVSRAGAMGLMQLMPGTWHEMRHLLSLGRDPHNPRDNILAGTAYLRLLYDRFGYPGLFAAYNAGPRRYSEYLMRGRRLPAETRAYVLRVASAHPSKPGALAPRPSVFVAPAGKAAVGALPNPSTSPLFVELGTGRWP